MYSTINIVSRIRNNDERTVYIMRGVPGVGKSDIAKLFAPSEHIYSAADYFEFDADGKYLYDRNKVRDAHEYTNRRIKKAMVNLTPKLVIDNTNIRKWEFSKHVDLASELGYSVLIVHVISQLTASELAARSVHGVDETNIQRMLDKFQQIDSYAHYLHSK